MAPIACALITLCAGVATKTALRKGAASQEHACVIPGGEGGITQLSDPHACRGDILWLLPSRAEHVCAMAMMMPFLK